MRIYKSLSFILLLAGAAWADTPRTAGPCGLLTKAEIQAASGVSVSDGVVNANNKLVCDFKAEMGVLNILLTDKQPADSAQKVVDELKRRKIAAQLVPGMGDDAYFSTPGYGMQQFGAFKGSRHVIVTVVLFGAPEAKAKAAADKVVRKAVGKL